MTNGTALVGFVLSFLTGAGLMWGVAEGRRAPHVTAAGRSGPTTHTSAPIPATSDAPSWGSANAPVTLVMLSDLECPSCARVAPTLARVKKQYGPNQLRVVWKHDPAVAQVDRDIALATPIGARDTPHFLINGKSLVGDPPFEKFEQLINEELGAADLLAQAGVAKSRLSLELTKKNTLLIGSAKPAPLPSPPPLSDGGA